MDLTYLINQAKAHIDHKNKTIKAFDTEIGKEIPEIVYILSDPMHTSEAMYFKYIIVDKGTGEKIKQLGPTGFKIHKDSGKCEVVNWHEWPTSN